MPDIGYSARSSVASFSTDAIDFPAKSSHATYTLSYIIRYVDQSQSYYGYEVTLAAARSTPEYGIDTQLLVARACAHYGIEVILLAMMATSKWTVSLPLEERRRVFISFFD